MSKLEQKQHSFIFILLCQKYEIQSIFTRGFDVAIKIL